MTNNNFPFFSIVTIKFREQVLQFWSNPGCHGCAFEWAEVCEKFGIHTRSDDTQCLFCVNNPNAVLPSKNYYKTLGEVIKETQRLATQ